jgi:hypothetical protein
MKNSLNLIMGVLFKCGNNLQFQWNFNNNNDDAGKDNKDDNGDEKDNRQTDRNALHMNTYLGFWSGTR